MDQHDTTGAPKAAVGFVVRQVDDLEPRQTRNEAGCGVTVLRTTASCRATKRWRWNGETQEWSRIAYCAGAWFHPTEHHIHDFGELVTLLDELRSDPRALVVRGALTDKVRAHLAGAPDLRIRRRKLTRGGIEPSLVEVPRRWVMIDIDHWPLPGSIDLVDDPETAIDAAILDLLPAPFQEAECWWQLSASAGFAVGVLKAHLFFWLTEPATNEHLREVLELHAPAVDRAPFNAAQPHFIADPIIEGGYDPLPRRTGWRKGLQSAVALPALLPAGTGRTTGPKAAPGRKNGLGVLACLGDGEGRGGFHAPLRKATMQYARRCNRYSNRDDKALKRQLRETIDTAPRRPDRNDLTSYDDAYLQRLIDGAFALLAGDGEIRTMHPHYQAPTHTVEEARDVIAQHVSGFLQRTLEWLRLDADGRANELPERAALAVGVGIGKTTAARQAIAKFITTAKAVGRASGEGVLPHRVLWLVPTHRLSAETLAAMDDLAVKAAVMRGREADEPGTDKPEDGIPPRKMCLNPEAVADALKIGEDVEQSVCGSGRAGEPVCPFRACCAYQRQKIAVAGADVVIAAHQSLFHPLPKDAGKNIGAIIVDETWWRAGLRPNIRLRLASFAEEPLLHPVLRRDEGGGPRKFPPVRSDADTNDLHTLSARAQRAFTATPDGEFVSREAVVAAGLSAEDCALAVKLEWRRKVQGTMQPGMSPDARKKAIGFAAGNGSIRRRVDVWNALEELLKGEASHTGRLELALCGDQEGGGRVILLHSRADIRDEYAALPILYLDATMPVQLVRPYLPRLEVLAKVEAKAPHMEVHQITGGWGKTSLVAEDKTGLDEGRRRHALVGELVDFVRLNSEGNGLVVMYAAIEDRFAMPGVRTAHFNAISGLDAYKDVRTLFVIGRPLPDPRHLRADALALTGRPIPAESGQIETRGALMTDGTGLALDARTYSDPDLEAVRSAVMDAEVIQAIGRGRGVNRDATSPLKVFVFADVALPLAVTRLTRWDDVRPDVIDRMRARGIILWGATDAAKAYPDLFPGAEAARKAIQRAEECREGAEQRYFPDKPLGESFLGKCPGNGLVSISYRPVGRGQQQRTAYVAHQLLGEMPAWLERHFGPLAHYEMRQSPQPPTRVVAEPRLGASVADRRGRLPERPLRQSIPNPMGTFDGGSRASNPPQHGRAA